MAKDQKSGPGVVCLHHKACVPDKGTTNQQRSYAPTIAGLWNYISDSVVQFERDVVNWHKQVQHQLPGSASGGFVNGNYAATTLSVGDGYCVPLVRQLTGAPQTTQWVGGERLKDRPQLKPGTAIATFDKTNKYPSKAKGNHAAIFVRYQNRDGHDGIVIYDQYRDWADSKKNYGKEWEKPKPGEDETQFKVRIKKIEDEFPEIDENHGRFRRKQPGARFIQFKNNSDSPSNDASQYSVIEESAPVAHTGHGHH